MVIEQKTSAIGCHSSSGQVAGQVQRCIGRQAQLLPQRQQRGLIGGFGQLILAVRLPGRHPGVGRFHRGGDAGLKAALDDFEQTPAEGFGVGGQIAQLALIERGEEEPLGLCQIEQFGLANVPARLAEGRDRPSLRDSGAGGPARSVASARRSSSLRPPLLRAWAEGTKGCPCGKNCACTNGFQG